jgi:hypothetical protein
LPFEPISTRGTVEKKVDLDIQKMESQKLTFGGAVDSRSYFPYGTPCGTDSQKIPLSGEKWRGQP